MSTKVEFLQNKVAYLKGIRKIKTQKDIAISMDMNVNTISQALKGNDKYLTDSFLQKFCKTFEIDEYKKNINHEVSPVSEKNYMMVEYRDLRSSAGNLGAVPIEQLHDYNTRLVPIEYDKGKYLVVRVDGDSMNDNTTRALCDGDEILIKEFTLNNGYTLPFRSHLFVISSNQGDVVKQIVEHNKERGTITCRSFNPSWDDYTIELRDVFSMFTVEKLINRKPKF